MLVHVHVHVCIVVIMCALVQIHDNQARQRYTPRTAFSFIKEETVLGGIRTHDTPRSR